MSISDAASGQPQRAAVDPESAVPETAVPEAVVSESAVPGAPVQNGQSPLGEALDQPAAVIEETEHEVELQRTVRYGRVLVGAAALGALVASMVCLLFPIPEGAEYTMGQVVGFSAIIGAAIGLAVGGLFSLVLGVLARRGSGLGIAIQRDVR